MNGRFSRRFTPDQAFAKARHYCAYQERSHAEVKEKLYSFGLKQPDVETILSRLIEENYLNEERFARQFAGGKFRMKQWGRIKITFELKQKRISAYNIKKAMEEIDETAYHAALEKLAIRKWNSLKNDHYIVRQSKTIKFLVQKGFEHSLIKTVVSEIRKTAAG